MRFGQAKLLSTVCPHLATPCRSDVEVTGLGHLGDPFRGMLAFAENPDILIQLARLGASAVITKQECIHDAERKAGATLKLALLTAENPSQEFASLLRVQRDRQPQPPAILMPAWSDAGALVSAHASVAEGVRIGKDSIIYPGAQIGHDVTIGARTIIHANAVVGRHVTIGDDCEIGPGSVVGGEPNWYYISGGRRHRFPSIGRVIIDNGVTVGANSVIDRGLTGDTTIGAACTIGNLVQIGHEVVVGKNVLIIAGASIAGNARLEDDVRVWGQAGIDRGRIIHKGAEVAGGSGVSADVAPGTTVIGFRAVPIDVYTRRQSALKRLPSALTQLPPTVAHWRTILEAEDRNVASVIAEAMTDTWADSLWQDVRCCICEQLGIDEADGVSLTDSITSALGADSLDTLQVQMAIEERLKINNTERYWTEDGVAGYYLAVAAAVALESAVRQLATESLRDVFRTIAGTICPNGPLQTAVPSSGKPLRYALIGALACVVKAKKDVIPRLAQAETYRELYMALDGCHRGS